MDSGANFGIIERLESLGVGTQEGVSLDEFEFDLSKVVAEGHNVALVQSLHEQTYIPSPDGLSKLRILAFSEMKPGQPSHPFMEVLQEYGRKCPMPIDVRQAGVAFTVGKKTPQTQAEKMENHHKALRNLKVSLELTKMDFVQTQENVKEATMGSSDLTVDDALKVWREQTQAASAVPRAPPAGGGEEESKEDPDAEEEEEQDQEDEGLSLAALEAGFAASGAGDASVLPQIPHDLQRRGQKVALVSVIEDYDCTLQRARILREHWSARLEERSRRYRDLLAQKASRAGIEIPDDDSVPMDKWCEQNPNPEHLHWSMEYHELRRKADVWLRKAETKAARVLPEDFEVPEVPEDRDAEEFYREKFVEANPDLAADADGMSLEDLQLWWTNTSRKSALVLPEGYVSTEWLAGEVDLLSSSFAEENEGRFPGMAGQKWCRWLEANPEPAKDRMSERWASKTVGKIWLRNFEMTREITKWQCCKIDFPSEESVMADWDVTRPPPSGNELPQEEPGIILLRCFASEADAKAWIKEQDLPQLAEINLSIVSMYDVIHPPHSRDRTIERAWRNKKQHELLSKNREQAVMRQELMTLSRTQGKEIKQIEIAPNSVQRKRIIPEGTSKKEWDSMKEQMRENGRALEEKLAKIASAEERLALATAEWQKDVRLARLRGETPPEKPAEILRLEEELADANGDAGEFEDVAELGLQ